MSPSLALLHAHLESAAAQSATPVKGTCTVAVGQPRGNGRAGYLENAEDETKEIQET